VFVYIKCAWLLSANFIILRFHCMVQAERIIVALWLVCQQAGKQSKFNSLRHIQLYLQATISCFHIFSRISAGMPSDQLRYLYSLTFILSVTKLVCFNRVRYLVTYLRIIFDDCNLPSISALVLIMDSAFSEAVVLKLFRTTWIW